MPFTYLRTFFLLLTGMYTECFQNVQNILLLYNGQFTSKSGSFLNKLFISLLSYGQFFDFWQVYILIIFKISKNNSHLYGLGEAKWKPQNRNVFKLFKTSFHLFTDIFSQNGDPLNKSFQIFKKLKHSILLYCDIFLRIIPLF